jgi:hypothetical protein
VYSLSFPLTRDNVTELTGRQLAATVQSSVNFRHLVASSPWQVMDSSPPSLQWVRLAAASSLAAVTAAPTTVLFVNSSAGASAMDVDVAWCAEDMPRVGVSRVNVTLLLLPTLSLLWTAVVDVAPALASLPPLHAMSAPRACTSTACTQFFGWQLPFAAQFVTTARGVPVVPHLSRVVAQVRVLDVSDAESGDVTSAAAVVLHRDIEHASTLDVVGIDDELPASGRRW